MGKKTFIFTSVLCLLVGFVMAALIFGITGRKYKKIVKVAREECYELNYIYEDAWLFTSDLLGYGADSLIRRLAREEQWFQNVSNQDSLYYQINRVRVSNNTIEELNLLGAEIHMGNRQLFSLHRVLGIDSIGGTIERENGKRDTLRHLRKRYPKIYREFYK